MIATFLARARTYGWAVCAGLIVVLYAAFKIMKGQRDEAREAVEQYKHQAKQRKAVDENLSEADQTFSRRATLREQEKRDEPGKVPDRLRDNNIF